jgi:hypothetical protein
LLLGDAPLLHLSLNALDGDLGGLVGLTREL